MERALNTRVLGYSPHNTEARNSKIYNVLVVYKCFLGAYGCTYECPLSRFIQGEHTMWALLGE
jgi:hypothetical protein